MTTAQGLLLKLQQLKTNGPKLLNGGICDNISYNGAQQQLLKDLFSCWPDFSGKTIFPVKHSKLSPQEAYATYTNLWNKRSPYGRSRWALLNFLIEHLETMVKAENG